MKKLTAEEFAEKVMENANNLNRNCSSCREGLLSVNRGRQALPFCLDPVVAVVIQIFNEVQFEVFHEAELLQMLQSQELFEKSDL